MVIDISSTLIQTYDGVRLTAKTNCSIIMWVVVSQNYGASIRGEKTLISVGRILQLEREKPYRPGRRRKSAELRYEV